MPNIIRPDSSPAFNPAPVDQDPVVGSARPPLRADDVLPADSPYRNVRHLYPQEGETEVPGLGRDLNGYSHLNTIRPAVEDHQFTPSPARRRAEGIVSRVIGRRLAGRLLASVIDRGPGSAIADVSRSIVEGVAGEHRQVPNPTAITDAQRRQAFLAHYQATQRSVEAEMQRRAELPRTEPRGADPLAAQRAWDLMNPR